MTVTAKIAGRPATLIDDSTWTWEFDGTGIRFVQTATYAERPLPCPTCSLDYQWCDICKTGDHDPCIGHVEGIDTMCCGHGDKE